MTGGVMKPLMSAREQAQQILATCCSTRPDGLVVAEAVPLENAVTAAIEAHSAAIH